MACKFYISVFVVFCFIAIEVLGQDCQPKLMGWVWLNDDYTQLNWRLSEDETCDISYYNVKISIYKSAYERNFTTQDTSLDVSFVPACVVANFMVNAVSTDDLVGVGLIMIQIMPLPDDPADYSLDFVSLTPDEDNNVRVDWGISDRLVSCLDEFRSFRVGVYDDDIDDIAYKYLNQFYIWTTVYDLLPCGSYHIAVAPMYGEEPGPETSIRYKASGAVTTNPKLERFNVESTIVSMVVRLEEFATNRCEISSVVIDASPYFTVSYPVTDRPNRPQVAVTLTGLQPDTIYPLSVTVVNSVGTSAPTKITIQTLPS